MLAELQTRLGASYTVLRELGGGGMSRVFEAEECALGRRVVIKVLPPELGASVSHERFRREILVAAQLRHPHIVPLLTAGDAGGWLYYTMPFIEGESLRDRIDREGPLSVRSAVELGREIAGALDHAHRSGVIHRDIKPENIMLEGGHAVVTDFGISVAVHMAAAQTLTATGLIVGTPVYMSPEQVMGETVDGRSDIYSLGCLLYEMLAGHPPFHGLSTQAVLMRRLTEAPSAVVTERSDAPESLSRIIRQALERAPEKRYQTAGELSLALSMVLTDPNVEAPPIPARKRPTAKRTGPRKTLSGRSRQIQSIAVLPFENAANDPDAEYLSEGITESVMNKLSRLSGLRVTARSVAFRYRGPDVDPVAAGRDLRVRAVVTGRVLQRGEHLTVSAELVEVAKARQLWGQQYARARTDIFAVQDAIATEISAALQVQISGAEHDSLVKPFTANSAAYEAYMKGRYHWNKRTSVGFQRALQHFQEAIDIDPNYSMAYSGLADTYNVYGYYNLQRPRDAYPRAKAAAARALEIDDTLAPAHASLGYARLFYDRDWPAAEDSFVRALMLDPGYASAHQWRAWYFFVMGRFDDALLELRHAHELDALSLVINDHLAYGLHLAGQEDEAIAQLVRTRDLDPSYPLTYWRLGGIYLVQGRFEASIAELQRAMSLTDNQLGAGYLGLAYGMAGRREEAEEVLRQTRAEGEAQFVSPLDLALIHAGLGDVDATFAELGRAVEERISDLVRVKLLPWPDVVGSDRRFDALVAELGLPASSREKA